jgi:hypothetical protein
MAETVTISKERLEHLEMYEAKVKAKNAEDTKRLIEYDKTHPGKAAERSKRCKERNHEVYLARRRELYRLKRAGATTPVDAPSTL